MHRFLHIPTNQQVWLQCYIDQYERDSKYNLLATTGTFTSESKPTTVTDSQVAAAVIIGSAVGGAVVLVLVFLTLVILIIVVSIGNRRRSRRIDENHTPGSYLAIYYRI